jgi:hypothetical protein
VADFLPIYAAFAVIFPTGNAEFGHGIVILETRARQADAGQNLR